MSDINPLDVLAIKNVVSRYCQALDTKDFDMLEEVFVPDVDADYPFNSSMKNVKESRAGSHTSQPDDADHNLQIRCTNRTGGNVLSRYTRPHEGKMLSAFGKYVDNMVLLEAKNGDFEGYDGPILASPIILHGQAIDAGRSKAWPIAWDTFIRYEKTRAANVKRWLYLYETARRAWELIVFDEDALKILISFTGSKKDEKQVTPDSSRGDGAICTSNKDPKANQIAITQNLRILSQEEDGDERILDFLMNELYGRRRRRLQGYKMITNDQSEFVNNLMWADSLEEHELARPIDNSDDDSDDDTYISHEQDYTLPSHDTETAGDGLEIAKNEAEDFAQVLSGNNAQVTGQTYRLGVSHAGTRIPVDPAGNEVTRLIPPTQFGTLYEQYLKMKRSIQEQYYGHETSSSDPDPHCGVPTKERFSGSTVKFVGLIVDSGPFGATNYETNREIVIQMLVNGSTTEDEAKSDLGGYIDSFLRRSTAEAA
ncbi:SnoaL-4 domain containing protein [Pyrenophora tritici-repentis]|nr:SnoaL-4 domain containing protein [Pyrenophora tritici-repentis]KAI1600324.1 SnoaL-4 domain containing protein [Pyrenophora tritici-repentis]PWO29997.1 phosphotransferase family protein [Pyrenophora tritici-repentis]